MPLIKQTSIEGSDDAPIDIVHLTKKLNQLLSIYRYRTLRAEQTLSKQKKIMYYMQEELKDLNGRLQRTIQSNLAILNEMNSKNTRRSLSASAIKNWIEDEHALIHRFQQNLASCREQEEKCAAQDRVVDQHYRYLHKKQRKEEKINQVLKQVPRTTSY